MHYTCFCYPRLWDGLKNSKLPMKKRAICFEILAYKEKTGKQIAGSTYYKY